MFVLTMGKNGLKRLGALAVAGVALAGVVFAAGSFFRSDGAAAPTAAAASEAQKTDPAKMKIANTESIQEFFKTYGMEVDLATATVDKVKIPKKWDESFSAFNTVVKESGMSLEKYKGKTVEKWLVLCPGRSSGDQKAYGVLLVYKEQPVGAYLLAQPGGEVTGLTTAAQTAAPAAAGGEGAEACSAAAAGAADAAAAAAAVPEGDANEATEAGAEIDLGDAGEMPIE